MSESCSSIGERARLVAGVLTLLLAAAPAFAGVDARMLRYPDVSATHIAFVYAGDIWVVDKGGGTASRLSSPAGEESYPRFSPDGSRIAFSGNYDGNIDVYVMPVTGGTPQRVTWFPGRDRLVDWSPDGGTLLFASRRRGSPFVSRFFRVAPQGGFPEVLAVPYGEHGALSPDGRRIAYTTKDRELAAWKRYRGGRAPDIWLFDLESFEARNLSDSAANEHQPMWHGDTLYFVSDRGPHERYNIWALDVASGEARQVTHFTEVDIGIPAIGPSDIVFQAGGRLHLLDLAGEEHREVEVEAVTDLATLRPQRKKVRDLIMNAAVSPSGKRAVFEARGEIFTVPAQHGVVRQLTRSSGVAERYPAWSPDGRHIAYWSDRSGEYELVLSPAGGGEEQTLTELGPGYRYTPQWSPDSGKIAFIDHTQTIQVLDVEAREISPIDQGLQWIHPALEGFEVSWSSDSRWIAYARHLETGMSAVFLFDTEAGKRHQVTSGYYNDSGPAFDADGKYLYYRSNRTLDAVYSSFDTTWVYPNSTRLVAVPLREDVASPLAPRNDEESAEDEDGKDEDGKDEDGEDEDGEDEKGKAEKKKGKKQDNEDEKDDDKKAGEDEDGDKKDKKDKPVEIALRGFEERGIVLPPDGGNYGRLAAVPGKLLYHRLPRSGSSESERAIVAYDLEEREEKTILDDAGDFMVSADGKKLLVAQERAWAIVDLKPGVKVKDRLAVDGLETLVDPRQEWQQLFSDVWRSYRDFFYDPAMHGVDWEAMRAQYGALLDDAVTRWDVNHVLRELIGEVNASHTAAGGGDLETAPRRRTGLLGVDWALEDGAYKIAHIVRGASWDAESRSPLAEPGLDVSEGDYVLAVNGVPLDTSREPYAAFEGLGEVTVELTVNDKPSLEGARKVLAVTITNERRPRLLEWIEGNRRRVYKASGGRIGYVFVPDTSLRGQNELVRQFTSQATKEGLIVDERWNGGGQLPDRFVELMTRQRVAHLFFRHGAIQTWPQGTHYGPKAMLINGWAGSGGDAFPFFFREMKAGPILGERTWGGLIGPAVGHRLIDGGFYTAPPARIYGADGKWFAEGHGVEPDIPVVDHPSELARGKDPQLEAAITEVMRLLEKQAPEFPGRPPWELRIPQAERPSGR